MAPRFSGASRATVLEQVGVDERDWEADLPDETKGQPMDGTGERATRVCRFNEALAWRMRVVPLYSGQPNSSNHRNAIRGLASAERETGAPDRALELILPLLEDKEALDRINVLDTAAVIWISLGERTKAARYRGSGTASYRPATNITCNTPDYARVSSK